MLVNFDPPGICLHDGGSIYLVPRPRIRSTGSFGPGDRFIGPPDLLPKYWGEQKLVKVTNAWAFLNYWGHVSPKVYAYGVELIEIFVSLGLYELY